MKKLVFFDYKANKVWANDVYIIMQLGLTMVGCIALCLFVGYKIDNILNLRGIFTSVFIILGIIGGANVVYRQIQEVTKEKDSKDKVSKENITPKEDETPV